MFLAMTGQNPHALHPRYNNGMASVRMIVRVDCGEELREIECDVEYSYTPGSGSYFCPSFGNWLPGDPPEIEVKLIKSAATDESFEFEALSERMQDEVFDKCIDAGDAAYA